MRVPDFGEILHPLLNTLFLLLSTPFFTSARNPCPSQSVSKCFNNFFNTYRFMQWPSCQTFEYLEKCFKFANCDMMELANLCSLEYRKVHNSYMPKEAIIAVHENLRKRCDPNCHRNSEQECTNRLFRIDQAKDRDHALMLEMKAVRKQLDLGMSPPNVACQQINNALKRLHANRKTICPETSVFCLCRRMHDELPKVCNIRCDQYRILKNRHFRMVASTVLVFVSVLASRIFYVYTYRG